MKLILHHFWKDVRLMRGMLALWFAILALQLALSWYAVERQVNSVDWLESWQLVAVASSIIWVLVIVRLVQAEPVRGASSFWRTRPVPPLVQGASKLGFILLLAVVPSLCAHFLDLWFFHATADTERDLLMSVLVVDAMMIVILAWLATYTRNVLQFWAVLCGLGAAFIVYGMVMGSRMIGRIGSVTNELLATRAELGVILFFGGLIVSLIVQYGFRRTRAALITGLAGCGLAVLALDFWPFAFFTNKPHVEPNAVRLVYAVDTKSPIHWEPNFLATQNESVNLHVLPPPTDSRGFPVVEFEDGRFRPPSQASTRLQSASTTYVGAQGTHRDWTTLLQRANPDLTVVQDKISQQCLIGFQLPPAEVAQIAGQSGRLDLKMTGHFFYLERCGEFSLKGSRWARVPNLILRVAAATPAVNGFSLKINYDGYVKTGFGSASNLVYLFVDPRNRIGVVAEPGGNSSSSGILTGGSWNRVSGRETVQYSSANLPADVQAKVAANQIDDWDVYVYEVRKGGPFFSDVTVPEIKL